ncbi:PBECR2 nuclease fold domain-containing protein [Neptunomonas antarctica]|uniref:PBECR2 nuclease fold domain-containing protein n=1 Tax=Neptunomonas antarctica TaxID=619304 RepID=UPI0015C2FCC6|nr:PBECR2 nuclease fold domain-containing protein [Neptunomonas antarctica]
MAGATKKSIVEGFANAVQGAISGGETLHDFRKRFDSIVKSEGWDYHGSRNWRSRLIYETNIRQAYNAGREAQMADPAFQEQFPYREYRHSGAENFRPEHKAWDGLLLLASDAWWSVHSPSNGYGCKCKAFPHSERSMQRNGKTAPEQAPADEFKEYVDKRTGEVRQIPLGIDPGFEYRPGESWLRHRTLKPASSLASSATSASAQIPLGPAAKPSLPAPAVVPNARLMRADLPDSDYIKAFVGEFGAAGTALFKDIKNDAVLINAGLFNNANGTAALSTAIKDKRYTTLLARALIRPDEIWSLLLPDLARPGKYKLTRRYINNFKIAGEKKPSYSVFETSAGTWSASIIVDAAQADKLRQGVLIYRRAEGEQ